jgi:hypothetical protein
LTIPSLATDFINPAIRISAMITDRENVFTILGNIVIMKVQPSLNDIIIVISNRKSLLYLLRIRAGKYQWENE